MSEKKELIRFDWAVKTILRDKANFDILEGILTALLEEHITVLEILESESKQEENLKHNRIDLLVKDSQGTYIIIEIQNQRQADYFERLLFGTSKLIVENSAKGQKYKEIKKVISISILYFDFNKGDDYIYYGSTVVKGMNTGKELKLGKKVVGQAETKQKDIFPDYYLINLSRFNDQIQKTVDEWIYMLKYNEVKEEFKSKNIKKAEEKLQYLRMDQTERKKYDRYMDEVKNEMSIFETAREEGKQEGIKEGIYTVARNMLEKGIEIEIIAQVTGLTTKKICKIKEV